MVTRIIVLILLVGLYHAIDNVYHIFIHRISIIGFSQNLDK